VSDGFGGDGDAVEVRVLGLPLAAYEVASEHMEELQREFALLAMRPPDDPEHELPRRLLDVIAALTTRYGGFTADTDAERDEAIAAGKESIDLTYRVPRAVAAAARELDALLDEADQFCRRGEHLLTLEAPPIARAMRRWYLGEFVRQIEHGEPPQSWDDYCRTHPTPADDRR
jgi:hypothetical protein